MTTPVSSKFTQAVVKSESLGETVKNTLSRTYGFGHKGALGLHCYGGTGITPKGVLKGQDDAPPQAGESSLAHAVR